jgi:hypothetical protein
MFGERIAHAHEQEIYSKSFLSDASPFPSAFEPLRCLFRPYYVHREDENDTKPKLLSNDQYFRDFAGKWG